MTNSHPYSGSINEHPQHNIEIWHRNETKWREKSIAIYRRPKLEQIAWLCSRGPVKPFPKLSNSSFPRGKKKYHSPGFPGVFWGYPGGRPKEKQMISALCCCLSGLPHRKAVRFCAIYRRFLSLGRRGKI